MARKTTIQFQTNIDCCRRFMDKIAGITFETCNPNVGDRVLVYWEKDFEIWMKVQERYWYFRDPNEPKLRVTLGLNDGATIPQFENMLRERGFSLS